MTAHISFICKRLSRILRPGPSAACVHHRSRARVRLTVVTGWWLIACAAALPARAANYEAAFADAAAKYGAKDQFAGVTLNAACRRLKAMDFIIKDAPAFEKQTGATVHFTSFPENELRAKLVADASAHAGQFSIYFLDGNYVPLFASQSWVRPIGDLLKPEYQLDDIEPGLRGLYSFKGRLYGLPIYAEVTILFYRKDLLEAAKLSVPKTMDDFQAAAKALTKPPQVYGVALRGLRGEGMNVYTWTEWLRSYGGTFLDPQMHPNFDSPAAVEATTRYAALIKNYAPPGSGAWGWAEVSSAFSAGRVAMIVDASSFYPLFNDPKQSSVVGKVGYAIVPQGPKGTFPANYSVGMAIPSTVTDAKTLEAAAAFIQWATSKEAELARTEQGIGNENRDSVRDSDLLRSKIDPAYIEVVAESAKITKPEYRPLIPQWREMGDIIGEEIGKVFAGTSTPSAALASAKTRTEEAFKQANVLGQPRPVNEAFEGK